MTWDDLAWWSHPHSLCSKFVQLLFDSVFGFKWTCDFSHLVALRENGRVMADPVESITDMEKTNQQK